MEQYYKLTESNFTKEELQTLLNDATISKLEKVETVSESEYKSLSLKLANAESRTVILEETIKELRAESKKDKAYIETTQTLIKEQNDKIEERQSIVIGKQNAIDRLKKEIERLKNRNLIQRILNR